MHHDNQQGDDPHLLIRLQRGEESAFEILFDAQYANLVRYAMRYDLSKDAARDLVQDVFIDIWNRRTTLQVNTTLPAYLYGAVRRSILSFRRHDRVVTQWQQTESTAAAYAPRATYNTGEGQAEADELSHIVHQTVVAMPARMREIFELSRTHGLSHAEIAESLGISVKTVAEQILRALRLLRDAISEYE
jgi:RNA polymerase sigma-70 factor (ECF subfamily)